MQVWYDGSNCFGDAGSPLLLGEVDTEDERVALRVVASKYPETSRQFDLTNKTFCGRMVIFRV